MSYTIEYDRKFFYLPKGYPVAATSSMNAHELWDNEYFMFIKQGCNNVYPRDKVWALAGIGASWQLMIEICERAGYTEGAGIQFVNGRTKPENYLKMYRKAIADAEELTIDRLKEWGLMGFTWYFGDKEPHALYQKPEYLPYIKTHANIFYHGKWYDKYDRYELPLTDFNSFNTVWRLKFLAKETGGFFSIQHQDNE